MRIYAFTDYQFNCKHSCFPSMTSNCAIRSATEHARAQGLAWLVRMYAEGFCSDYRFSYEHASPSVALLHSEAVAQAAAPQWGAHRHAAHRLPVGGVVGACAVVGEATAPAVGAAAHARSHQVPSLDRAAVGVRAFGTAAGAGFDFGDPAPGPASGAPEGPEDLAAAGGSGGGARRFATGAAVGGRGAPLEGEYVDGLPRERAPLLPTACALALLPGGAGEAQVPSVRPLHMIEDMLLVYTLQCMVHFPVGFFWRGGICVATGAHGFQVLTSYYSR